jgi:site-specific DNA-cytosine methylase
MNKPIVFDLFCGLGGWSEAFISEGYRAIGFDIEAHDYGTGGYPGELVLRDVRSITGAELVKQYGVPAVIVASPPCQEFSYMAMPWTKAKDKMRKILADPAEQTRLTDLFNQCFRIQREVSQAAGHYVPMIVENVRGAQRWVGTARWNFGSFYLWGDVPALMPIPSKVRMKSQISCAPSRFDERIASTPEEAAALHYRLPKGVKLPGNNSSRTDVGKGARFTTRDCGAEGSKGFMDFHDCPIAQFSSKSSARKKASAEIAKIPPSLALWIARTFKPQSLTPPPILPISGSHGKDGHD